MDRLDAKIMRSRFNVNEAHSTDGHPAAGIEHLNQLVILRRSAELLLDHPKHFRLYAFQFMFVLIRDAIAALDRLGTFLAEWIEQHAARLGQRLVHGGGHFGQHRAARVKTNHMSIMSDVDDRRVKISLDAMRLGNLKQFG